MPFFVYILKNSSNKLYIGQTNNLDIRTLQHQMKDWKAAKFTKDGDGFMLVYHEEYPTRLLAMQRKDRKVGPGRKKKH